MSINIRPSISLVGLLDKLNHGNPYDMPKVMLHEENAFDRLEPPYRSTAGRQAMSCHDDMTVVV